MNKLLIGLLILGTISGVTFAGNYSYFVYSGEPGWFKPACLIKFETWHEEKEWKIHNWRPDAGGGYDDAKSVNFLLSDTELQVAREQGLLVYEYKLRDVFYDPNSSYELLTMTIHFSPYGVPTDFTIKSDRAGSKHKVKCANLECGYRKYGDDDIHPEYIEKNQCFMPF